jgi:UDP-N-acetylglucosamine 4,6-dehydratase
VRPLADVIIKHYGNSETKIREIGAREGEKVDELLISEYEAPRSVIYDNDYYVIKSDLKIDRDYSHLNDKQAVPFDSYSSSYEISGEEVLKSVLTKGGFLI